MRNRKLLFNLIAGLAVAVMSLPASADLPFASPGKDSGMIVGSPGEEARDIFPVRFIAIDGQNIQPREVIWLEPGKYTLTVSSVIRNPRGLFRTRRSRGLEDDGLNEIEVVVEAGKSYHVGVHYEGRDRRAPYSTVIHRVEDQ